MLFSVVSARRKAAHQRGQQAPRPSSGRFVMRVSFRHLLFPAAKCPAEQHPQGAHEHPAPEERRRKPNEEKGRIEPRNASNAPRPQQFKALQAMGRAKHSLSTKGKRAPASKGPQKEEPSTFEVSVHRFQKRAAEQRIPRKSAVAFVRSFPVPETDSPSGAGRSG